ncbi:MAG: RNA methyltransferase [Ruminococcaceae bacterium]|nr:RNA methyltransferase [Oscillospiraceae bacterium]
MDIITSRNNPLVVETAKLKDKKHREENKSFLFEGIKLTREAISSGVEIERIFLTEKCSEKHPDIAALKNSVLVSDSVCQKLSENSAPEGIICRAKYLDNLHKRYDNADSIDFSKACLILSSIQDPGNMGTIARTSAAFGKMTLIISSDSADIYNQKTIRASMGAMFRISTYRTDDLCKTIEDIRKKGFPVYATALTKNAVPIQKTEKIKNCCFVMGNEGHGLDSKVIQSCSGTTIIPMEAGAESLNVSSAASVILWETYR